VRRVASRCASPEPERALLSPTPPTPKAPAPTQ
jgi:hypothetical protein